MESKLTFMNFVVLYIADKQGDTTPFAKSKDFTELILKYS